MANWVIFHEFKRYMGEKELALNADTFKAMLVNSPAPDAAVDDVKADLTEITAQNGYAAGGVTLTGVTWTETGAGTGVWRFTANDITFGPASGGSFGPARYIVIWDDTSTTPDDLLVCYLDYGTNFTVTVGNSFLVDIQANGIIEQA